MNGNTNTQDKLHLCGEILDTYAAHRLRHTRVTLESHLPAIIQRARDTQSSSKLLQQRLISETIFCWKNLKIDQDKKNKDCGHLFNPLASIPIGETTHSCLLGDLLNPKGSHGQGKLLLEAFLDRINVPTPKEGNWMISIEERRVDICLWRKSPPSVILIENKSNWAIDQPNQLYRYWYENIQKPYPLLDYSIPENKQAFQLIYLAPAPGKQPEQHSLQRPEYLDASGLPKTLGEAGVTIKVITFRDHITTWLDYCGQFIPTTNTRLRSHLQFYKELWN